MTESVSEVRGVEVPGGLHPKAQLPEDAYSYKRHLGAETC